MKIKKIIAMFATVAIISGIGGSVVMAAPKTEANLETVAISEEEAIQILEDVTPLDEIMPFSLSTTTMRLTKKNNKLYVAWTVKSTCVATKIGISSLKLQMYSNGTWKNIKKGSYSAKNKMVYTSGYSYASAKSGVKYRAVGTAYTIVNGIKKTSKVKTSEFTY
ncbi:hypothetical protein AALA36_02870 [Lachnospiraceae bacterium 66-29]|jgi:hypothetical protein